MPRTFTLTQIHRENGRLYVRWSDDGGAVTEQEFDDDVPRLRDKVGELLSEDVLKTLVLAARLGADPALSQNRPLVMRRVIFDETTGRVEVV